MAKQATKKASVKKEPKAEKVQRILKKALIITGVGRYDIGSEVTPAMEKAWKDYYLHATGGPPIRSIDWYC